MIFLDDIRRVFEQNVTETLLGMPIQYDNVLESNDVTIAKRIRSKWARLVIMDGAARAVSCGSNVLREYSGTAIIMVFCPHDIGTKVFRDSASAVSNFFLQKHVSHFTFFTPSLIILGKVDDWVQGNIQIPFTFKQLTN